MQKFRVGVDIGGTFTDIVFLGDDGQVLARKIASTPDDYSQAVLAGIKNGVEELGITAEMVSEVSHGFTVATNAIIEQKGAKTALITTEGFRDILEFRRNRIPRLYDLEYEKPPPLVKRQFRLEVGERLNFKGEVLKPLNKADVDRALLGNIGGGQSSVGLHHGQRHLDAHLSQPVSELGQVGFHHRTDVTVDDRGAGAFVFFHLGQQFRGDRQVHPRRFLGQYLGDTLLVFRVGVGV